MWITIVANESNADNGHEDAQCRRGRGRPRKILTGMRGNQAKSIIGCR